MNTRPGPILVAGATGNQGGATLRAIYSGLKNIEDGLHAARSMPAPLK